MYEGIILAAGKGTRLLPFTEKMPKAMIDIDGRPLIYHQILWLIRNHINSIIINLHHHPDVLTQYLNNIDLQVNITYSYEKDLLGTAGAIKKVEKLFTDTFIVYYGDVFTNLNLRQMLWFHKEKNADITMFVTPRYSKKVSSVVILDPDSRIMEFIESPNTNIINSQKQIYSNSGIYIINKKIINEIPEGFYDFGKDLFPKIVKNYRLFGYSDSAFWIELGTLDKYEIGIVEIAKYLNQNKLPTSQPP